MRDFDCLSDDLDEVEEVGDVDEAGLRGVVDSAEVEVGEMGDVAVSLEAEDVRPLEAVSTTGPKGAAC